MMTVMTSLLDQQMVLLPVGADDHQSDALLPSGRLSRRPLNVVQDSSFIKPAVKCLGWHRSACEVQVLF